jgi:FAD-dependent oxidoreductase domain-containing protein 1
MDVLIVGGGIMGWSAAYHLLRAEPSLDVLVIEQDPTYRHASTTLCEGNVRIQFDLEENVRISMHTAEVLATFADDMAVGDDRPDPAPRREGNLFLVDEEAREAAVRGMERQVALGCRVEWLDADAIARRFPALAPDGLIGGTFGRDDGRVDAVAMHRGYRAKARHLGAGFAEAVVREVLATDGRVTGVRTGDGDLTADVVLVAAGAWTPDLLRPLGVDLPVEPVMRTAYVVGTAVPTAGLPAVFLPSGVYAIPEGATTWVSAWSLDSDPIGYDFTPATRERYVETVWPELVTHLPAFDRLQVESSWAGLYAVNRMDGNGIIGEWPTIRGLHLATGFSGHGFQQAPAVGRYLAEGILGLPHALDLSRLGPRRVIDGVPLRESAGRLI